MKGKVGIGKLALYGREYLVAVKPHERGIVMYTLHHAGEIRRIDTVEEIVAPAVEAPARVVNLMDALKKSLDAVSIERKKPAKATAAKPVAKRKRA